MKPISRAAGGALLVAATLALAACAGAAEPRVTRLPSDMPAASSAASVEPVTPAPSGTAATAEPPSDADASADCTGRSVTVTPGSAEAPLRGECSQVEVQGNAFEVDASGASVAVLSLSGDRIVVRVGSAGQLIVQGNDAVVSATDVSMLDLRGDRNTVTVSGTIGGVSFQGNDNVVHGTAANVSDGGARNSIG